MDIFNTILGVVVQTRDNRHILQVSIMEMEENAHKVAYPKERNMFSFTVC